VDLCSLVVFDILIFFTTLVFIPDQDCKNLYLFQTQSMQREIIQII
jgi:hypothetical protein